MDIVKVMGLPAHPLLVHLPIVLIPATAGLVIAAASSQRVARWLSWAVPALAVVTAAATYLAIESGEAFFDLVRRDERPSDALEDHADLAPSLLPLTLALLAIALVVTILRRRDDLVRLVSLGVAIVAVVIGVAAVARVAQVGHLGATSVWSGEADDDRGDNSGRGNADDRD